ncbi:MAG: hypothetical protein JXK94_10545, partial [Deltaproteobacteria bacterium]|nr:hypothetical protein [Deltaproteobacteria bacterium]
MEMRLVLFPALGTDERIFSFIGEIPGKVVFHRLPNPSPDDSMATYASRLAKELNVGGGDFIGGVSFGGMVAAEISCQRRTRGLILISSGLSSHCINPVAQRLGRLANHLPGGVLRSILGSRKTFKKVFGSDQPPLYELAARMLDDSPTQLLVEGGRLSLNYWPASKPLCPVYAIHGQIDSMIFPPEVSGCKI